MARLVVNPGTDYAWEIPLRQGVTLLGRDAENDFPLEEDSVSGSHCEVHLEASRATIRDLGSANGTFINHAPVQECVLQPGQKIHIGTVELAYYPDAEASAKGTVAGPHPVILNEEKSCKIHFGTRAKYYCPTCKGLFCEICVSSNPIDHVIHKLCRKCNRECSPVRFEIMEEPEKGFYAQVPDAFVYPLRGAGLLFMFVGTVMVGAIKFAAGMSKFSGASHGVAPPTWWGLMLQVIVVGYLFCYMQNIIHSTALGEKEMPSLPDVTSFWDDILLPCLQLIGVTLISFGPLLLTGIFLLATEVRAGGPLLLSLSVLGGVYFPMAFLIVAMTDNVAAANPMQVIPSIFRVPAEYLTALGVLGLIFVARALGDLVLHLVFPKELLTHSASQLLIMLALNAVWGFISFYLLTVGIRILGVLYVTRKDTLAWLNH